MVSFRIVMATLSITMISANAALAFEVDQSAATSSNAARLGDPDDKIPFPHVADDGTPPSNNFQAQSVGNTGISFGITPSNSQTDAFQRAQDRMQQ